MTAPSAAELREHVNAAISEVSLAERALEKTLKELASGRRAEKVAVSAAVSDAFARLRAAHAELIRLKDLVSEE